MTAADDGYWCQLFDASSEVASRFPQYCGENKAGIGLTSKWCDGGQCVSGAKKCGPSG